MSFWIGIAVGIVIAVGFGIWLYRKIEHEAFLRFWG